jgi:hypothetical protein
LFRVSQHLAILGIYCPIARDLSFDPFLKYLFI